MADFRNEFTWSWSRHRTFERCSREYWLQYYGSWGGWLQSASTEVRDIYVQKKLTSRPAWIGILIHEAAEWVIKQCLDGESPDPAQLVQRYRRKALQQIKDSETGLYRYSPTRHVGFIEHYYPDTPSFEPWEESVDEIARQLTELEHNRVFQRVLSVLSQVREVEELKQLQIGDVKAWVSIDVLVGDETGGFTIVDWKTGKAHTDDSVSAQLGVYALYVLKTYLPGVPESEGLGRINTLFANLRRGEHKVWSLTVDDLEKTRRLIKTSAEAMRSRLDDIPGNIASKERFPQIPEGSEACGYCRFRGTCGR